MSHSVAYGFVLYCNESYCTPRCSSQLKQQVNLGTCFAVIKSYQNKNHRNHLRNPVAGPTVRSELKGSGRKLTGRPQKIQAVKDHTISSISKESTGDLRGFLFNLILLKECVLTSL